MKNYKRIVLYAVGFAIVSPMVTVFFNLLYIICWKFYDGITISIILNNLSHYIQKTIEMIIRTYYVFGIYSLFFGGIFGARRINLEPRLLARKAGKSYMITYLVLLAIYFILTAIGGFFLGAMTRGEALEHVNYSYVQWTVIVAPFFTIIAGFLSGAIPVFVISKFCKTFDKLGIHQKAVESE